MMFSLLTKIQTFLEKPTIVLLNFNFTYVFAELNIHLCAIFLTLKKENYPSLFSKPFLGYRNNTNKIQFVLDQWIPEQRGGVSYLIKCVCSDSANPEIQSHLFKIILSCYLLGSQLPILIFPEIQSLDVL